MLQQRWIRLAIEVRVEVHAQHEIAVTGRLRHRTLSFEQESRVFSKFLSNDSGTACVIQKMRYNGFNPFPRTMSIVCSTLPDSVMQRFKSSVLDATNSAKAVHVRKMSLIAFDTTCYAGEQAQVHNHSPASVHGQVQCL